MAGGETPHRLTPSPAPFFENNRGFGPFSEKARLRDEPRH